MKIFGRQVPVLFSLLIWLVIWEIIGRSNVIFIFPPFSKVLRATVDIVRVSTFFDDVMLSLRSFASGVGLSLVVGIPLGFMMGRSQKIDDMLGMWVNIFISAPITAIVPIIMVVFGIGPKTITVTVFLFSIWPVILDTRAGVKHISYSLIEMARVFGASRFDIYRKVLLWAALPEILAGLRLAIIRGVRGMIVGQLLLSIMGFGKLFLTYSEYFLMDRFFALLIFILAFAWGLSSVVGYFERRVEKFAKGR
ncbi:MAG: ABC transporter permease [Deltaproteobacteria bacterium]|nr:ABC transporter permease [Deltaproteobacteria bacterium]